jgi:hypothetical protein
MQKITNSKSASPKHASQITNSTRDAPKVQNITNSTPDALSRTRGFGAEPPRKRLLVVLVALAALVSLVILVVLVVLAIPLIPVLLVY